MVIRYNIDKDSKYHHGGVRFCEINCALDPTNSEQYFIIVCVVAFSVIVKLINCRKTEDLCSRLTYALIERELRSDESKES